MIKAERAPITSPDTKNDEFCGFKINGLETEMLRTFYDRPNAVVISPENIRESPLGYWKLQEKIVISSAKKYASKKRCTLKTYKEELINKNPTTGNHLKYLNEDNDWIYFLLSPEIQKDYFENLPYTRVPPYMVVDGVAIPVLKQEADIREVTNDLPFLNHIEVDKNNQIVSKKTVPGVFVEEVLKSGGFCIFDHGICRLVIGTWGQDFDIESKGYVPEYQQLPRMDVDTLVFSNLPLGLLVSNTCQAFAGNTYENKGLNYGSLIGRTMTKIPWAYIAKPIKADYTTRNPYNAAHDKGCILQAIKAWSADPTEPTELIVDALLNFSRLRGMSILPEVVTDRNENCFFAAKFVDPLGGILDYSEAGGGLVTEQNERLNIISFPSIERAFPKKGLMSIWHLLRTVEELFYRLEEKGGAVFMPSNVLPTYKYLGNMTMVFKAREIFSATQEIQIELYKVAKLLNKIRRGEEKLDEIFLMDIRKEMVETTEEMIDKSLPLFFKICDETTGHEEEYNFGIEFTKLFPHLQILKDDANLWNQICKKVSESKKTGSDTNIQFLCKIILSFAQAQKLVSENIQRSFIDNPERIGNKMIRYRKQRIKLLDYVKNGFHSRANWRMLDLDGIGQFTVQENSWLNLLRKIKNKKIDSQSDMHTKRKPLTQLLKYMGAVSAKKVTDEWKDTEWYLDEQARALKDWLLDPCL